MRKYFTLLFICCISCSAFSQISLDQGDFPTAGWELDLMEAYNQGGNVTLDNVVDIGASGPAGTYDISGLMPFVFETNEYVYYSNDMNGWATEHPDAVAVLPGEDMQIDDQTGDTVAMSFDYYGFSGNGYYLVGKTYVIDFEGLFNEEPSGVLDTVHVTYDLPHMVASMDYELGYYTIDSSYWEVTLDDLFHSESVSREIFVDGWGDLETPDGVVPVLRVKVTEIENFLTEFDGNVEEMDSDTSYYYEFWAKQTGLPIAKIVMNESFDYVYSVDYTQAMEVPVSAHSVLEQTAVQLYPNPTQHEINLAIENLEVQQLNYRIIDAAGQQVVQKTLENPGLNTLQIAHLPNGLYFLILEDSGAGTLTERFIIQK